MIIDWIAIISLLLVLLVISGCGLRYAETKIYCEKIECEDITIKNVYIGGMFIPDNSTCIYDCII